MPEKSWQWVTDEQKRNDRDRIYSLVDAIALSSSPTQDEALVTDLKTIIKAAIWEAIRYRSSAASSYDDYTKFIGVLEALFNADWTEAEVYLQSKVQSTSSSNAKSSVTRVRTILKSQIEAYITITEYRPGSKAYVKDSIQQALLKYIEWWVHNWYTGEFDFD